MKNLNQIISAFIIICISSFASAGFAQFEYFSGEWRSFSKETHMEKLTEDDYGMVKLTQSLNNGVSDKGRQLIIGFTESDEAGNQSVRSFTLLKDNEENITGSDVMNTVKFTGKITGNTNEQFISLAGNSVNGLNEIFGMELIYQNTESGRILQMKLELAMTGDISFNQVNGVNYYQGREIETRPASGNNQMVSYWQVFNFKPYND